MTVANKSLWQAFTHIKLHLLISFGPFGQRVCHVLVKWTGWSIIRVPNCAKNYFIFCFHFMQKAFFTMLVLLHNKPAPIHSQLSDYYSHFTCVVWLFLCFSSLFFYTHILAVLLRGDDDLVTLWLQRLPCNLHNYVRQLTAWVSRWVLTSPVLLRTSFISTGYFLILNADSWKWSN